MTDPNLPEGFPDLFVFKLRDILAANLSADPDFPAEIVLTRALRASDPTRSVSVVEGEMKPLAYEIGQNEPSNLEYQIVVQVMVKHGDEIEGRNIRKRLLSRVRKTLFLQSTINSLMTLNDGTERALRWRFRRIDFSSAEAKNAAQYLFLGQIELAFETEWI